MNPNTYLIKDIFKPELKSTREGFGEGLVLAGEKNKDVVVVCADVSESTKADKFKKKFSGRFVEVGVAEQNMVSIAAGMSFEGKISFVSSYAVFNPGRNNEQIRTNIAYSKANVKIAGSHAGITVGEDGATHQALEDVGLMRMFPNFTVVVPCDFEEAKKAVLSAAEISGPVYLRFFRNKTPIITTSHTPFNIGKAEVFKEGKDVVIFASGPIVYDSILSAIDLEGEGISVAVVNVHTVKPLDEDIILKYARKTKAVITAEDHQIYGGFGSAVSELLAAKFPVPIEFVGIKDKFGESGKPEELVEKYEIGVESINKSIYKVLRRK